MFLVINRTGCFAISDQPTRVVPGAGATQGVEGGLPGTLLYMGVRLGQWHACPVILTQDSFLHS